MREFQKSVIEHYLQAYNSFDVAGMLKDLHDEVEFEHISGGQISMAIRGKKAFKEQAQAATAYFKERSQEVIAWHFDGDLVLVDIDYRGVLAIDFPNGMRAGETLRLKGQSVFSFLGDQVIKIQDKS